MAQESPNDRVEVAPEYGPASRITGKSYNRAGVERVMGFCNEDGYRGRVTADRRRVRSERLGSTKLFTSQDP